MVNIKTPFSRSNQQQQRRQEQEQKSKNNHRGQHNNDENKYLLFVADVDNYDVDDVDDDDDDDDDDVECQSGDLVMTPFWHQLSRSRSYPDPNWINPFSIGQTTAKEVQ